MRRQMLIEEYGEGSNIFAVHLNGQRYHDLDANVVFYMVKDMLWPPSTAPQYPRTGVPSTDERRQALLTWICEYRPRPGLEAAEIARRSGAYTTVGHYAASRCFDDLKALEKLGFVKREGRPALWSATIS